MEVASTNSVRFTLLVRHETLSGRLCADGRNADKVQRMEREKPIEELTRRNVAIIAEMEKAAHQVRTRGDRVADQLAAWVGSWTFIMTQSVILIMWIVLNIAAWVYHWVPYPFILLNLAPSFQSAYAAPILMISQNRQAKLDRRRNHLDLQINMLAEQETTAILHHLRLLCEHLGIGLDKCDQDRALEQATQPSEIIRQIRGEIEEPSDAKAEVAPEIAEVGPIKTATSPVQTHGGSELPRGVARQ